MDRRRVLLALLATPLAVGAQASRKPMRIGVLSSSSPESRSVIWDTFKLELVRLGWAEGREVSYEYRYARGDVSKFDALAADLVAQKPDLIFAGTEQFALAARRATREIPIVFALAIDPVASGLVASLAHPAGNATGLSQLGIGITTKHIELLKEIRPGLRRVAVLASKTTTGEEQYKAAALAAKNLGVETRSFLLESMDEIDRVLDAIARERPDGLSIFGFASVKMDRIVARTAEMRIPAVFNDTRFADAGGIISYGVDFRDLYRRAAGYVDRILRGAKPADLPVQQATVFEIVVNLKAAKAQGIEIPQLILLRATRVIE